MELKKYKDMENFKDGRLSAFEEISSLCGKKIVELRGAIDDNLPEDKRDTHLTASLRGKKKAYVEILNEIANRTKRYEQV